MTTKNKITSWDAHLDNKYGKRGSDKREEFQENFEAFKIGVLIQEARKVKNSHNKNWQIRLVQQKITFLELRITPK